MTKILSTEVMYKEASTRAVWEIQGKSHSGLFFKFLKNMTNKQLIFGLLAVVSLLNLINGLDRDYGTHKKGF